MIKKLQAGDSTIPASGWNEMRAFIQNYSAPQDTFKNAPRNPFLISVQNSTGAALEPLSVVELSTLLHARTGSTFANKGVEYGVEFNGIIPTGSTTNIAVLQGGIQNNCIGKAIADGLTPCFVYKAANKNYKYARPFASHSEYLEATDEVTNIKILISNAGTGKQEAIIRIGTINPQSILNVTVTGLTGGGNAVYATIGGSQIEVIFPNSNAGLSAPNFPDIYPGDEILVMYDSDSGDCYAADYPTDYENGTLMAFYSGQGSPGRGWDAQTTAQAMTDAGFTLYQKVKTNAIL